jgi:hypothetical protein
MNAKIICHLIDALIIHAGYCYHYMNARIICHLIDICRTCWRYWDDYCYYYMNAKIICHFIDVCRTVATTRDD